MRLLLDEDETHAGHCLLMKLTEGGCIVDQVHCGPHALDGMLDAFSGLRTILDESSRIELIRTMRGFGYLMERRQ